MSCHIFDTLLHFSKWTYFKTNPVLHDINVFNSIGIYLSVEILLMLRIFSVNDTKDMLWHVNVTYLQQTNNVIDPIQQFANNTS